MGALLFGLVLVLLRGWSGKFFLLCLCDWGEEGLSWLGRFSCPGKVC